MIYFQLGSRIISSLQLRLIAKNVKFAFKVLLFVDNALCHQKLLTEAHKETQVDFLPANTNSLLQSVDRCVNSAFRSYYLRRVSTKTTAAVDGGVSFLRHRNKIN